MKIAKAPIWCVILIILSVTLFIVCGFSWSGSSYRAKIRDYHIVRAINQARGNMSYVMNKEGSYDDFSCDYGDMRVLCKNIDASYGSQNSGEPIIVHGIQTVCIYSPLNAKGNYWYCADSQGNVGYTSIDPGSKGYCVEGESAKCPPVSEVVP